METFINRAVQFQLIKIQLKCRTVLLFLLNSTSCSRHFSFIQFQAAAAAANKLSFSLSLSIERHTHTHRQYSINYLLRLPPSPPSPFESDGKSINHKRLSEPNMVGAGHDRFAVMLPHISNRTLNTNKLQLKSRLSLVVGFGSFFFFNLVFFES